MCGNLQATEGFGARYLRQSDLFIIFAENLTVRVSKELKIENYVSGMLLKPCTLYFNPLS